MILVAIHKLFLSVAAIVLIYICSGEIPFLSLTIHYCEQWPGNYIHGGFS